MYVHHIFVWSSYYIALLNGAVFNVSDEKNWDEAVEYCKKTYNGTLSSLTEIENSSYAGQGNVWTRSSKLTPWLSIQGCYNISERTTAFRVPRAVSKRCSEGCRTPFIGTRRRRCICLSGTDKHNKTAWQDCHQQPMKQSAYIVYRKYRNSELPMDSMSTSNLSDPELNCGAVTCNTTGYFQSRNCKETFRFRCAETRSTTVMTWKKGKRFCSKNKSQSPQSFEEYCKKESTNEIQNDSGVLWIGMYRPLSNEKKPFEECTYLTENQTELVNCSLVLHFFCTGTTERVDSPQQNPKRPPSTVRPRKKRHGHRRYLKVLTGAIAVLGMFFVAILIVMFILLRRMKRNARHLRVASQMREQSAQSQQPNRSLKPKELEKDLEDIYEFEEIQGEDDSQLVSCRNFAVKCPLPPEKVNCSTGRRGPGMNAASRNYSSVICSTEQEKDACAETNHVVEPGSPRHGINDPASLVVNNYDSFNSSRVDNSTESDIYDHAKIVTVKSGKADMVCDNPESTASKLHNIDGIYDLAKGVENEYDELSAKIDRGVLSDTYDHVT